MPTDGEIGVMVMTIDETYEYCRKMKETAEKDTDKRAAKCVEAMERVLEIIVEHRQLQNRCNVWSGGILCMFCGTKECAYKGLSHRENHERQT